MTSEALSRCRDTNLKVLNILTNINAKESGIPKKDEDVTEFVTTIQLVQITINSLLKTKKDFDLTHLKTLQDALDTYEVELRTLFESSKLLRFFASTRLRRKLEQLNSTVHRALDLLKKSVKEDKPKLPENRPASSTISASSPHGTPTPISESLTTPSDSGLIGLGQRMGSFGIDDEEEDTDLQFMIEDEDGKGYWRQLFGLECFMVDHNTFIEGLKKKALFDFTPDEQKVLLYIIDNGNTGMVNQHKFSEILKGFGPITEVVRNIRSILSCPWFYGFLSRAETDILLRDEPSGSFLIRFSSSQPGSFALGFNINGSVSHILIKAAKSSGFIVPDQDSAEGRHFPNLFELVDFYRLYLISSYNNLLPLESFFEGDMSGAEAMEALAGYPVGTFLVRFSLSCPGNFAISFVAADQTVGQGLINREVDPETGIFIGYKAPHTDYVFPDVKRVIEYYGETLLTPLKSTTNQAAIEAQSIMIQWREERSASISNTYHLVSQIFDLERDLPFAAAPGNNQEIDNRVDEMISRLFPSAFQ